jgi:ABC-type sugar transport system ATPase subunit
MVLELVRRLRDHGLAVAMISHNLNDVFAVADRIAVLYLGRMAIQDRASVFDRQSIVEYMTTGGAGVTTLGARPSNEGAVHGEG